MRALGNYMMRGSVHAVGVTGTLTVISWFLLPFAHVLSGAPLALVALRRGPVAGMQVMAGCFAFVALVGWAAGVPVVFVASFPIMVWIPVWLAAMILRRTESQAAMVLLAASLGIAFALGMRLLTDDPGAPLRQFLEQMGEGSLPAESEEAYRRMIARAAPLFNGALGAGLCTSLVVTMVVARWWQALLFNPGGFRSEFHRMLLPRRATVLPAAGLGAWLLADGTLAAAGLDVLVVSLFMYLFQGIATVHRTVAGKAWSPAWLALMYGSFVLVPHMVLFVACLGLADSWMGGARNPAI